MVFHGLVFFSDPASVDMIFDEKNSYSTCLDDSNKPLDIMNNPTMEIVSKFSFVLIEFIHQCYNLSDYLSPPSRLLTVTVITISVT